MSMRGQKKIPPHRHRNDNDIDNNSEKRTKRKELNPITTRKSTKAAVEKSTIVVPNNILIVIVIVVIVLLFFLVLCTTPAGENDINLTPPKQLTLTLTLPLLLQFLAALVQLLLVTTNFKSELHHMLCDLTIQRHTVAITYDLSEIQMQFDHKFTVDTR